MEFRHPGADEDVSRPRSSPFYASIHRPMGVEQALEWSTFSDWAMLPQVFYFQGVPDLFLQLMDAEALHDASAKMRAFNDEEPGTGEEDLISAVQNWRRVAQRLAFAVTGETGDDACKVDVMVLGPGSLPIGWALELGNVAQFNGIILGEDLPEIPAGASEDVPGDLERRAFESEDSEQQERVRSKDTDEPQFEEDGVNVTTQNEQAQPSADAAATQGGHEEPSADAAAAQGDQAEPSADAAAAAEPSADAGAAQGDQAEPSADAAAAQGDQAEPSADAAVAQGDQAEPSADAAAAQGDQADRHPGRPSAAISRCRCSPG
ncbi:unnamed protein product [Effrenium voratum]|nr:unnamed protein product [Effrenium voratum]